MSPRGVGWPALLAGALLLAALQLWLRPLLPVDETRYLAVAWEMWWRGDFLVPWLNGEPYSHKPPLLFWLIHALWTLFGVSEIAARAVPVVLSLAALWLSVRLATRLWGEAAVLNALVPWLLLGGVFWNNFYTLVQFDLLLVVTALLAWHGVLEARDAPWRGWTLAGLGIGLGVLAKGPVILVPVLPALLFAPWWARTAKPRSWARWYLGGFAALTLGAGIALAWAIPAGMAGGDDYRRAIFWGQSAGRMVDSFAHRSPWWSYVAWLPLMWLPWLLWPRLWGALRRAAAWDDGLRFCVAVLVPALLVFSLISGKQGKYLLPLFPPLALAMARLLVAIHDSAGRYRPRFMAAFLMLGGVLLLALPWLPRAPAWSEQVQAMWGMALLAWGVVFWLLKLELVALVRSVALGMLLWTGVMYLALMEPARPPYQLEAFSHALSGLQTSGHQLAWLGKYHGQFHFLGRLQQRIEPLAGAAQLRAWLSANPDGYLLVNEKTPAAQIPGALLVQSYRGGSLVLWPAAVLLREPARLDALTGSG